MRQNLQFWAEALWVRVTGNKGVEGNTEGVAGDWVKQVEFWDLQDTMRTLKP